MKKVLIIVDPQNDFITGSLAVPGAEDKMIDLSNYLKENPKLFDRIYVTMDSHPIDHCSFVENGGIWPTHCIADTIGWDIPNYLDEILWNFETNFCRKGTDPNKEEYSIFKNEEDGACLRIDLEEDLKESTEIYVCGIAGDYCVYETTKNLKESGLFDVRVLLDCTASIDGGTKITEYVNA